MKRNPTGFRGKPQSPNGADGLAAAKSQLVTPSRSPGDYGIGVPRFKAYLVSPTYETKLGADPDGKDNLMMVSFVRASASNLTWFIAPDCALS